MSTFKVLISGFCLMLHPFMQGPGLKFLFEEVVESVTDVLHVFWLKNCHIKG